MNDNKDVNIKTAKQFNGYKGKIIVYLLLKNIF